MSTDSAFTPIPHKNPNFVQRLVGKQPRENAVIALNNLFADAGRVRFVTHEDMQNVSELYGVNLYKDFRKELAEIYRQFLDYCLADKALSDEEVRDLSHLKHLLGLNDQVVQSIHDEAIQSAYGKAMDEVLLDVLVTPEEKVFLEKIKRELLLPEEVAKKIFNSRAQEYLQRLADNITVDQRLSPDEEVEFNSLSKSLGIDVDLDSSSKAALEKFRLFWLIENGDIPEVPAGLNLQHGEKCFFICTVNWYENRSVTRRIRYGGPAMSFRIAKGFYWRAGDMGVQRVSEDVMAKIDSGRVYLTNKRVLFVGGSKNVTIRLSKILDFNTYKNGVEIQKDSGKNPFLEFNINVDVFAMILARVLRDSGESATLNRTQD